jgi:phosphoglycerate dehydrogenase-like enzyme
VTKPLVAVLDAMPPASRHVISTFFEPDFRVLFVDDDSARAKREAAAEATVLLTMWGAVDADTIAAAPHVRLIQKLGVGTDKIDISQAERHKIVVLKAAGINADAVAEVAVLLTLAVGRNLPKASAAARTGLIAKESLRAESFQLLGKTVGLIGLGHIGQAVARRLVPFGVRLIYHDLRRAPDSVEAECHTRYVEFDDLVSTSDVISLHLPSTSATDKIINAELLRRTRPGLIVVNTARGSLIDEDALAEAIRDGRVLGAGLDVTATEPLAADSPLLDLDRVVLTPHIGGAVANNFPRVIDRAYRNAHAVLGGGDVEHGDVVVWPERTSA